MNTTTTVAVWFDNPLHRNPFTATNLVMLVYICFENGQQISCGVSRRGLQEVPRFTSEEEWAASSLYQDMFREAVEGAWQKVPEGMKAMLEPPQAAA